MVRGSKRAENTKERILFVDDEPAVLSSLRRMLHRERDVWDMTFLDNPHAALAALLRSDFDVVVTDGKQLLHHSDRGCQYTSDAYQSTLKTLGIECSMSRTGNCYDNAVMERFFWSIKHEWTGSVRQGAHI